MNISQMYVHFYNSSRINNYNVNKWEIFFDLKKIEAYLSSTMGVIRLNKFVK